MSTAFIFDFCKQIQFKCPCNSPTLDNLRCIKSIDGQHVCSDMLNTRAREGDVQSMALLAICVHTGTMTIKDLPKAFDIMASCLLYMDSWMSSTLVKSPQTTKAAVHFYLAEWTRQGLGVDRNVNKAFGHYSISSDCGNADATAMLGILFEYGESHDLKTAFSLYKKASKMGSLFGSFKCGLAFELGKGVEMDFAQAKLYYRKAAKTSHFPSLVRLSVMQLDTAYDTFQDYYQAFKTSKTSRSLGQLALYSLKSCKRIPSSNAVDLLRQAANDGNCVFQYILGEFYYSGLFIDQDYPKALYWYQKSALQGFKKAQKALSLMYENGFGVEKNLKLAKTWTEAADVRPLKEPKELVDVSTPCCAPFQLNDVIDYDKEASFMEIRGVNSPLEWKVLRHSRLIESSKKLDSVKQFENEWIKEEISMIAAIETRSFEQICLVSWNEFKDATTLIQKSQVELDYLANFGKSADSADWMCQKQKNILKTSANLFKKAFSLVSSGSYVAALESFSSALSNHTGILDLSSFHVRLLMQIPIQYVMAVSYSAESSDLLLVTFDQVNPALADALIVDSFVNMLFRRPEKSIALLDKGLLIKKTDPTAVFLKGCYYAQLGNLALALEHFDTCIKMNPAIGEYYFQRAVCYSKMSVNDIQLLQNARQDWQMYLQVAGKTSIRSADCFYCLAMCNLKTSAEFTSLFSKGLEAEGPLAWLARPLLFFNIKEALIYQVNNFLGPSNLPLLEGAFNNQLLDSLSSMAKIVQMVKECAFCNSSMLKTRICTGCTKKHYCSRNCQIRDWSSHSIECSSAKLIE